MNYREYEEFKNQITSEKLKENIELYYSRLSEVYNDNKIIEGLDVASRIRKIIQKVLFEEGCKYIWLVPIETSIDEYRLTHRGSKGVKALNVTDKNGDEVYTTGATPKEVDFVIDKLSMIIGEGINKCLHDI